MDALLLADVRLDSDIVRKVDEGGGRKKEISVIGGSRLSRP